MTLKCIKGGVLQRCDCKGLQFKRDRREVLVIEALVGIEFKIWNPLFNEYLPG